MQGIKNWFQRRSRRKGRHDRETHQRDLFESIERGEFPKWKFSVQIMPESDVGSTVQPVRPHQGMAARGLSADRGRRSRTERNPENYFAEVEQAA